MKILFVVPTSMNLKQMYMEYPMGAGYICTYLRHIGYDTKIVDQNVEDYEDEDIVNTVENYKPDLIAFSIMTPCYIRAKNQVKVIKEKYNDIPVIAGGIHVTLFGKKLFEDGFDALMMGEGEIILQRFSLCYEKTHKLLKSENIEINPATHFNIEIDKGSYEKYIYTDELLLNRDVYNLPLYKHHSLLTTRGCPFRCKFCCNYSKVFGVTSYRPTESVIREIKLLVEKYNARQFFFADDIFFLSRENIIEFCNMLQKENLNIEWVAQLRVTSIDEKTAILMKQCGCTRIYFGVESGSQKILDDSNKRVTIEEIKKGIKIAKNAGIRVKTGWIIGLPGSYEEQMKSIDLMLETMPNEISIHQLIPFPGTDYYEHPEKYGIVIRDKLNFESFCYGGISNNFYFTYLSNEQIIELISIFTEKLDEAGYISSDLKTENSNYIYTSPLSKKSLDVFRQKNKE